ncbi:probable asparagine--tRNA ligase, mitochondrial [Haliotis rufescens]|uniref:probable asparagine--tRNA ligase, mitochondrial n=1 Tax=Haliotis rufescens TaxID=6454 RepID=UPI001EB05591|nr:probable asparagine--tRNA ligase, mitochondrial [Haliotis rufescens]
MAAPLTNLWKSRFATINPLLRICKGMGYSYRCYSFAKQSIARMLEKSLIQDNVKVKGWVRALRGHRDVIFLHVSDGSCVKPLQVVADPSLCGSDVTYGCCVSVEGRLVESSHPGQMVEVAAHRLQVLGPCDPVEFPFKARKKHSADYIRTYPHLRPRTNTFSSLLRIRSQATMAFHKYFQENGFCQIHTPILTSSDCEGAGEVFCVEPANSQLTQPVEGDREANHFFKCPTYLNVSGQLHLEVMSGGFSRVYTFGPTFRAENSRGRHHLCEFYMIEAELVFTDTLEDIMQVMEEMVRTTTQTVMESAQEDVHYYLQNTGAEKQRETVEAMATQQFKRITYTEAISLLHANNNFQFKVQWGADLQKEHERWLTQHLGDVPVFVTDFPAQLKPFYTKLNPDNKTVGAVDLLVPGVGELIGGSLREDNYDTLHSRLEAAGEQDMYDWYLDLRKYGSAPHGGFGLGFERYLQHLLGTGNIRDVIPFPRSPGTCKL